MKYYTGQSIFKYSFDQLTLAFWQKYPNPCSNHVLSEDTVERKVVSRKLYSKRMLTKTNKMPRWGERFFPASMAKNVCVVEETVVDPIKKTLTTYTRNIGLTKIMMIEEKCTYRPSTDNKDWTVCERQAWVNSTMFGFSYALQAFGLDRFKKNANKAIRGFEYVMARMYMPETVCEQQPSLTMKAGKLKAKAQKAKELATSKAKAASVSVASSS